MTALIQKESYSMKAIDLYEKLEKDFMKSGIEEDWFEYMDDVPCLMDL